MGFSFAALGTAYGDEPVLGLVLSALVPMAAWPVLRLWLKRKERAAATLAATAAVADAGE
jgi:hypothetical protein